MTIRPRPRTRLSLAAPLLTLPLLTSACAAEFDDALDDAEAVETADDDEFRAWNPQVVDPNLCDAQPNLSRGPSNGICTVELSLVGTSFVGGQGTLEGRGELSTVVTATGPNAIDTVASVAELSYNVGQDQRHSLALGNYQVQVGQTKTISVCAEFIEHDAGGQLGNDDMGIECEDVVISCDANNGQPTFSQTIGPATLCGDGACIGSASATVEVMRVDADGDSVPNRHDFTPEPCDELDKGTEGVALLLYYHYGEGVSKTYAETFINDLAYGWDAYDYVVLVADNAWSNPNNDNGVAFKTADGVFEPSRDGLRDAMQHLTALGYRFDVGIQAEGIRFNTTEDSGLSVIDGQTISGVWLENTTVSNYSGTALGGIPIVSMWGAASFQDRQKDSWKAIGAQGVTAPPYWSFFAHSWPRHLDTWTTGTSYYTSVNDAIHDPGITGATQIVILGEGAMAPYNYNTGGGVLDSGPAAWDFFKDNYGPNPARYDLDDFYSDAMTGYENLSWGSRHLYWGPQTLFFADGQWP